MEDGTGSHPLAPSGPDPQVAPHRPASPQQGSTVIECPVCYDALAGVRLPCDHAICDGCATQWFRRQATCPMCRAQVGDPYNGVREESRALFSRGAGHEEYDRLNRDRQRATAPRRPRFRPSVIR